MKRLNIAVWLLPLLAIGFLAALVQLFQLRYQSGDVYPPYSSLRADPLGTKALYASLDRLGRFKVRRNLQPLDKMTDPGRVTLFWLGMDSRALNHTEEDLVKQWEALVIRGGRLVLSFSPENAKPWEPGAFNRRRQTLDAKQEKEPQNQPEPDVETSNRDDEDTGNAKKPNPDPAKPSLAKASRFVSLGRRWHLGFSYEELPKSETGDYLPVTVTRRTGESLPEAIAWRTALYFELDPLDFDSRILYAREGRPVLIERKLGSGTLILSADSYFLSNQAMRQDRYPELLAWLAGSNPEVVFDETHLGVAENPGVATLARKYRLHGVLTGLLLLAVLYIWKNASSLVPRHVSAFESGPTGLVGGRDSAAGFVNLLRRSIPASEVLGVCVAQWKSAQARDRSLVRHKVERVQAALEQEKARPARERSPVAGYRTMNRIVSEKDWAGRR